MDVLHRAKVRNKRKHVPEQNTNYGSFCRVGEENNSNAANSACKKVGISGCSNEVLKIGLKYT